MTDREEIGVVVLRSNPVAPDPRVEKLAATLIEIGHRVTILAWDRTGKLATREENPKIGSIFRFKMKAKYGSGLRNLPYLLLWQLYLVYFLIFWGNRYHVIHACDFDTVLPAIIFGKLLGKRVVFDIFDLYAESVRDTPGAILKLISIAESFAINKADAVILADEARKEQIAGTNPKRLIVIYNSPAREEIELPVASEDLPGLKLVYVGLLVKERSLLEVIELVGKHSDWHLDLAGFGGDEEMIVKRAGEHANITWHGRVAYPKALALTAAADLVFAIYDPAVPNHRYSSPNKIFEAMLLGKPLVVAHDTNMDRIVKDHKCGMVVTYGKASEIEQAFEQLAGDPNLRTQLGANGRQAFEREYSWELMKQRIKNLYREL